MPTKKKKNSGAAAKADGGKTMWQNDQTRPRPRPRPPPDAVLAPQTPKIQQKTRKKKLNEDICYSQCTLKLFCGNWEPLTPGILDPGSKNSVTQPNKKQENPSLCTGKN